MNRWTPPLYTRRAHTSRTAGRLLRCGTAWRTQTSPWGTARGAWGTARGAWDPWTSGTVPSPGGATPRFWTPTTRPTNCWPEAPWGGGGGGGSEGGGFREGEWGGGIGGAGGGGSRRVGGGGGPSGAIRGGGGGGLGGAVVGVPGPAESPPPPVVPSQRPPGHSGAAAGHTMGHRRWSPGPIDPGISHRVSAEQGMGGGMFRDGPVKGPHNARPRYRSSRTRNSRAAGAAGPPGGCCAGGPCAAGGAVMKKKKTQSVQYALRWRLVGTPEPFLYSTLVQILLTTNFCPLPQKMVSSFRGIEASKSKIPLGDCSVRQNNDFARGWPSNIMPWVCYANDPQKGRVVWRPRLRLI